jgi:hypothetical protein
VDCQACDNVSNAPRVDLRGEVRARVGFAIWCGGAKRSSHTKKVEAGERSSSAKQCLFRNNILDIHFQRNCIVRYM